MVLSLLSLFAVVTVARAEDSAGQRVARTELEESLVAEALAHYSAVEETIPDGKLVEGIDVYVAEVFDDRDPVPNFLNIFHVRTQDAVVSQEVLLAIGAPWDVEKIRESERNLRAIRQHSIANIVAVRGSRTGAIRLLVVVKDVWSLRMNSHVGLGSAGLDTLVLNPTEENLLGTRTTLGLLYMLQRDRTAMGGTFAYPRIGGSRMAMAIGGGVYHSRHTGAYEGNYGNFSFGVPQYSRFQRWGYGASASWQFSKSRQYVDGEVNTVTIATSDGDEVVPVIYETDSIDANYYGLRSFGVAHKRDLTFGLDIEHNRYRASASVDLSSEAEEVFVRRVLPQGDTRIGPYVGLSVYESRFLRTRDVESLSIQEDLRLGYGVSTLVFAGAERLGSTRDFVGARSGLGYSLPVGNGLVRVGVRARGVVANENRHEATASARVRFVSPHFGWARLHVDGMITHRHYNYLNTVVAAFGGNNRLRGYGPSEFRGGSASAATAELRTSGVDILSAQVGMVGFYDVAAAAAEPSDYRFRQGAGAGLRFLFPQAERTVLRLDWGFPLSGDRAVLPGAFYFTFGQAFSMQTVFGQ